MTETPRPSDDSAATLLAEASQRLTERFSPLRVLVFGSYARGTAGPDSDLDLLLVMSEVGDPRAVAIEARRVLADLPVPKDVIVTTPEEVERRRDSPWHVVGTAVREGRVLYERASV